MHDGDHMRALLALTFGLLFAGWHAAAQDLHYFRIATGNPVGTYFPVGAAIASAISSPPGSPPCSEKGACGVDGLIAVALSSEGSVYNVGAVSAGVTDSGLAQADTIFAAYNGQGIFKKPLKNLRVIANLYPESLHLVVRRGAGIARIRDLVGKRVSLDVPGSGTRGNAEGVLEAYGVNVRQLKLMEVDPAVSADLLLQGELDAFFFVAGYPAQIVQDLAQQGSIDLLAISGAEADRIVKRQQFFARDAIPEGSYPGIATVDTISIGAQWVVAAEAGEDLVYRITQALWRKRNRPILDGGHAKARQIRLETALAGVATPLHPGAARFYRELGRLDEKTIPSQ